MNEAWWKSRLADGRSLTLGEVTLGRDGAGFHLLGPRSSRESPEAPLRYEAFVAFVRETEDGVFRPLPGARTLRGGWQRSGLSWLELMECLDAVYPLAGTHRAQAEAGTLRIIPEMATLCRQTGAYARARTLSESGRKACRAALCGRCVRTPVWAAEGAGAEAEGEEGGGIIPCPEACGVYVALAQAAAGWQADPPPPAADAPTVGFAAFQEPGNAIRNRVLGTWDPSPTGEG